MDRPSCSYWVTIHGTENELNKVLTQLQSERLDPNSILQSMTIHGDQEELRLEVTDGAMDQTDEIYTCVKSLPRITRRLKSVMRNAMRSYIPRMC